MEEMMVAERRTNLPLDQLIAIATGKVSAPSCYNCSGVNFECENGAISAEVAAEDIGIIFTDIKDAIAEKTLTEIIPINPEMALIGYAYLSKRRSDLLPETEKFLKEYEENPQNAEDLRMILDQIAEVDARC